VREAAMAKQVPKSLEGFDPFGALVGLRFTKWETGYSRCILEVDDRLLNPHGTLHGGATYTMADSGMGATLYSCIDPDEICATIEINIVYFKAITSGILTCDTRVIHRSKRIATLESEITMDGSLVAKAIGTWSVFKEKKP
jgi:acyl-CoA thioesterase